MPFAIYEKRSILEISIGQYCFDVHAGLGIFHRRMALRNLGKHGNVFAE